VAKTKKGRPVGVQVKLRATRGDEGRAPETGANKSGEGGEQIQKGQTTGAGGRRRGENKKDKKV